MINQNDKYQTILTHLHELNRTIVLNESDKTEQLSSKLDEISNKLENNSGNKNKQNEKFLLVLIIISLINMLFIIFIFFNLNANSDIKEVKLKISDTIMEDTILNNNIEKKVSDIKIDDVKIEDILTLNKKSIAVLEEEDDDFSQVKPIIRKDTKYTCKEDINTYKIPYTVEIKGKLYKDMFKFILQENNTTKECTIKKENI